MGDESTIMKINHSPTGNGSNHHLVNQNVMLLILSSVTCSVSKSLTGTHLLGHSHTAPYYNKLLIKIIIITLVCAYCFVLATEALPKDIMCYQGIPTVIFLPSTTAFCRIFYFKSHLHLTHFICLCRSFFPATLLHQDTEITVEVHGQKMLFSYFCFSARGVLYPNLKQEMVT